MTINEYIRSRGLTMACVAQTMGVTRQVIEQYGKARNPNAKSLIRMASTMTELGAPTTVADLVAVLYSEKEN